MSDRDVIRDERSNWENSVIVMRHPTHFLPCPDEWREGGWPLTNMQVKQGFPFSFRTLEHSSAGRSLPECVLVTLLMGKVRPSTAYLWQHLSA